MGSPKAGGGLQNYMETGNDEVPRDKETRYYKDRTVGGGGGRA